MIGWAPRPFGPGPQVGGEEIVISLSAQPLSAYENRKVVTSTCVGTGMAESPETPPLG